MSEIIVVHGYAGSGKSTQAQRISRHRYNGEAIIHVSAGNRLRAIRSGLEMSQYSAVITAPDASSPLPDEIVNGVMLEKANPAGHGMTLIDGYPRHMSGVEVFLRGLEERRHRFLGSIGLEITEQTSVERILSRGERQGELLKGQSLAEYAIHRYQEDAAQSQMALNKLGDYAPVERVDANADLEEAQRCFDQALARLGIITLPTHED